MSLEENEQSTDATLCNVCLFYALFTRHCCPNRSTTSKIYVCACMFRHTKTEKQTQQKKIETRRQAHISDCVYVYSPLLTVSLSLSLVLLCVFVHACMCECSRVYMYVCVYVYMCVCVCVCVLSLIHI